MKLTVPSSYMVITVGSTSPALFCVFELNSRQNSMMFLTPCWPSAGPRGGAGFAPPPSICTLTIAFTGLAISACSCGSLLRLEGLHLFEIQFDLRIAAKH